MNEQEEEIEYTIYEDNDFAIHQQEAEQLWNFLKNEYISYEFYPLLPEMLRRLSVHVK